MRKITRIFIHHSASDFGSSFLIDEWHREKNWDCVGYHYVITNGAHSSKDIGTKLSKFLSGQIEFGRPLDKTPSQARGLNKGSIGICLIHKDGEYKDRQLRSLKALVLKLMDEFNLDETAVFGHYEVDTKKKECPGIDMDKFRNELYLARRLIHQFKKRETEGEK